MALLVPQLDDSLTLHENFEVIFGWASDQDPDTLINEALSGPAVVDHAELDFTICDLVESGLYLARVNVHHVPVPGSHITIHDHNAAFESGTVAGRLFQGIFEVEELPDIEDGEGESATLCLRDETGACHVSEAPEKYNVTLTDTKATGRGETYALSTEDFHAVAVIGRTATLVVKEQFRPNVPALVIPRIMGSEFPEWVVTDQ